MNPADEIILIKQCKDGDQAAFERIVLTYRDRIYNLCRYMLGNPQDAEDAAQDVFIKAYQNLKHFKPHASLYTWLYRIAINTSIDYRRKRLSFWGSLWRDSSREEDLLNHQPSSILSPEQLYTSKELGKSIQFALQKLSTKLRTILILKEIEGLSYEEIAAILKISIGTVKSRLSRAREEMKKLLKEVTEQR